MTIKEYFTGVKNLSPLNKFNLRIYNARVAEYCNFKVRLGELLDNLATTTKQSREDIEQSLILTLDKDNNPSGVVSVKCNFSDEHNTSKRGLGFYLDADTTFVDGTTLSDNIEIVKPKRGKPEVKLLPNTDIHNIMVKVDVSKWYMINEQFVEAILKSNIVEGKPSMIEMLEQDIKENLINNKENTL